VEHQLTRPVSQILKKKSTVSTADINTGSISYSKPNVVTISFTVDTDEIERTPHLIRHDSFFPVLAISRYDECL
jgi:hypothetical protein